MTPLELLEAGVCVRDNNIKIIDSSLMSKKEFQTIYDSLIENYEDNPVLVNRSEFSLKMEWAVHKALYKLKIKIERTKDVDLEYPQEFIYKILYPVLGMLVWPFI